MPRREELLQLASSLVYARRYRRLVPRPSGTTPLTTHEAYAVQRAVLEGLVEEGQIPVGLKLGFTNPEKAAEMGIDQPIVGVLMNLMAVDYGSTVATSHLFNPRLEPEVAFKIDLRGCTSQLSVAAALEIVDSRYVGGAGTAQDVIADNASAAGFVIGPWRSAEWDELDEIADAAVSLTCDDELVVAGRTSAVLGDPRRAIELARELAQAHGLPVPSDVVILAGAATLAIPLRPGHLYRARVEGLQDVTVVAT